MPSPEQHIILGIDPGTLVMGYGVIAAASTKACVLEMGVLQLAKYKDPYHRLLLIWQKIQDIIKHHKPTSFAIEAPFYGKNVQSMLKLGRSQGVAIAAAMSAGLSATEYMPKKVKQSVTGNGNATKEQVAAMLQQILKFDAHPQFLDATDAVAVALCHYYQTKSVGATFAKQTKGWEAFIAQNPNRVLSKK